MGDDRELPGHGNGGLLGADPPRQACPPGLQRRPVRDTMEDDPGRLVQIGAQQLVAAARDMAGSLIAGWAVKPSVQRLSGDECPCRVMVLSAVGVSRRMMAHWQHPCGNLR